MLEQTKQEAVDHVTGGARLAILLYMLGKIKVDQLVDVGEDFLQSS